MPQSLKIYYQCQNYSMIFRHESDKEAHSRNDDISDQRYREYELEEFMIRSLVAS